MLVTKIEALIKGINDIIGILRCQGADLLSELRNIKQIEFETKHGVKSGDKLTTKNGKVVYYDHLFAYGNVYFVLCHTIKKDGTASKVTCQFLEDDF